MLWSKRQFLSFIAMGAVSACGFTPAYAPGGSGSHLQNTIEAAEPLNKPAFDLVERLEERLGPPDLARYKLGYTINLHPVGVAISPENAITRYHLNGSIDWALTSIANGQTLTQGKVTNFTSYSATGSTVAGLAAEEDASLRLMRILADQIVSQLLATSGQWGGGVSGE
jgi:LPS-assembly lipoprotein